MIVLGHRKSLDSESEKYATLRHLLLRNDSLKLSLIRVLGYTRHNLGSPIGSYGPLNELLTSRPNECKRVHTSLNEFQRI